MSLTDKRYEELIASLKRMSLVQDQILTKLHSLQPPQPVAVKTSHPKSPEHEERAHLLSCPKCNGAMQVRYRKSDGNPFFGCTSFPDCNGIRNGDALPSPQAIAKADQLRSPIRRPERPPSPRNDFADDNSVPF